MERNAGLCLQADRYGHKIQDVEDDICAGWVRMCAGDEWVGKNPGSTNWLCGYMEWMLVGTEMGGWQMSGYLCSEWIFVCAQIKQAHKTACNEYR